MTDEEIDYDLLEVEKGNRRFGIYLKNEIKELKKERNNLYNQLQQKENIIKEVREYIREKAIDNCLIDQYEANFLIKILDKGE